MSRFVRRKDKRMFKRVKSNKVGRKAQDSWPRFTMGRAVCRWTDPDGKHRVYLIAREDGVFCYVSMYFSDAEFERAAEVLRVVGYDAA